MPITDHAFSSNPHDDDLEYEANELHNADDHTEAAYDPHIMSGRGRRDDDSYQSIHTDTEEGTHLGRPLSWGQHGSQSGPYPGSGPAEVGEDTSYHGAATASSQAQYDYPSQYQQQGQAQQPPSAAQDPFRNPSPYRQPSPMSSHDYGHGHGHSQAPQLPPLGGGGDPFRDDLALSHEQGGYGSGGNSGRVDIPDASDYRPGSRLA